MAGGPCLGGRAQGSLDVEPGTQQNTPRGTWTWHPAYLGMAGHAPGYLGVAPGVFEIGMVFLFSRGTKTKEDGVAHRSTRRRFLKQSAAMAAGFWVSSRPAWSAPKSANEKLNVAVIGVGNRGYASVQGVAEESIVALCDVDENLAARAIREFPKARFFKDYRRMLDTMGIGLDAVCVCTPDHTHAVATIAALKSGKHVYCEKPLTHSVWEARRVIETAAKTKLATQMGTQIHSGDNYRRVVELIQTGAIGDVGAVHVWCGTVWAGGPRPTATPRIPDGLAWDAWLGPAPARPYHPAYHPAKWRGHWDFGGGGHADMACHFMDVAHWALELRHPSAVEASGPPVDSEHAPDRLKVVFEYPARGQRPPVKLTWLVGSQRPDEAVRDKVPAEWGGGVLFVGEKGMLLTDYGRHVLLPEKDFADFKRPEPFIPPSIGHHREWIQACKDGRPTTCSFEYSGALTETVLLGNVAYRSGNRIEWDAKNMKIPNAPEAEKWLRREYREGWSL